MIRFHRQALGAVLVVALFTGLPMARVVAAAPDSAAKLVTQIDVAIQHAGFAYDAKENRTFQMHAHHVVNILVGRSGRGFNASFGNPGDGYGALEHARDLRADNGVAQAGWQPAAQIIAGWLEQATEAALEAASRIDRGDITQARTRLVTAIAFLSAAKGREGEKAPGAGGLSLKAGLPSAAPQQQSTGGYY